MRLHQIALALLVGLALTLAPATAATAHRAGTFELENLDQTGIVNLDPGDSLMMFLRVSVTGDKPTNVHVTSTSAEPGLTVDEDTGDGVVATQGAWVVYYRPSITATAGLHSLDITVTSDNYPTFSTSLPVWGRGGPAPAATGNLTGRRLFDHVVFGDEDQDYTVTDTALSFLDATWVYLGRRSIQFDPGKPIARPPASCHSGVTGCFHYAYDPSTGQVQVDGSRGLIGSQTSSFDNASLTRFVYPPAGSHLSFHGSTGSGSTEGGPSFKLKLMMSGRYFREVDEEPTGPFFRENGRYVIGKAGALTLVPDRRKGKQPQRVLSVIEVLTTPQGTPAPQAEGVGFLGLLFS